MPAGHDDLWASENVKVRDSEFLYETSLTIGHLFASGNIHNSLKVERVVVPFGEFLRRQS